MSPPETPASTDARFRWDGRRWVLTERARRRQVRLVLALTVGPVLVLLAALAWAVGPAVVALIRVLW